MHKNSIERLHSYFLVKKRLSILSRALSQHMPDKGSTCLDIGCGDAALTSYLAEIKPHLNLTGVDVLKRISIESAKRFHYQNYDGKKLPFNDNQFDMCYLVDVLHHTDDPGALLAEATRVTKHSIIIKDHLAEKKLDHVKLKIMDYVGNKSEKVHLPYHYLSKTEWVKLFKQTNLELENNFNLIKLYGFPISLFFGKHLHFIAKLNIKK